MNIILSAVTAFSIATAPIYSTIKNESSAYGDDGQKNIQLVEKKETLAQEEKTTQSIIEDIAREKILVQWRKKQNSKWQNLSNQQFVANISAYTAAADECGKSDGITASGLIVREKQTLACPPEYPFGAQVEIEGMGVFICEDRGGAIKGNRFDIYVQTKTEAFTFGRQNRTAHVVF